MRLLDFTLPKIEENLALDEALLLEAEGHGGGDVLRFWEWPAPAVVLGAGCKLLEEVRTDLCEREGVPMLRRSSGGGTVLLGKGCLSFSLILSYERNEALRDVRPSYCFILGKLCEALAEVAPGIACAGTSDLAVDGWKVSGNSQQRKRTHLLHHGTLLYDFDVTEVSRYLLLPPRQPEYRHGRPHAEFLRNLNVRPETLKALLAEMWGADPGSNLWPEDLVAELVRTKYGNPEWIRRR
jgi:lipoate-protein ligase A